MEGALAPYERRAIRDLPWAGAMDTAVLTGVEGHSPAVFLDYDGTLTPIVTRPELARLSSGARHTVARLARRWPVAILSGRDLDDIRSMVGIEGITYAGSHGFDIATADGLRRQLGTDFLPSLDAAERELRLSLSVAPVPGAWVERKRFAVALHYRQVDQALVPEVEQRVVEVAERHSDLRQTGGKRVFELRPAIDWDKGKALIYSLELLGLDGPDVVPVHIGDDETDEDAFEAVRGRGFGIIVAPPGERRATAAGYRLGDPEEVRSFLDRLASIDLHA